MKKSIITIICLGFLVVQTTETLAEKAPDFTLPLLNKSGNVSLKDYRGKVVLIDLWASWCAPCRISFPLYNQLYHELKSKGFEILAINMDLETAKAEAYLKLHPVDYPVLSDPAGKVASLLSPTTMPYAILVDRDGNIVSKHAGFYEDAFKNKVAPEIRALVGSAR